MDATDKRGNDDDLTGRDRMGRNIGAVWLGHAVVVVSGFIIPRLIDHHLDQASLGVWDFGWSTVSYFRFLGLGLAGSVNRYVARYRARGDMEQLRRAVSSAGFLQVGLAMLTMLAALVVGYLAPSIFHPESPRLIHAAPWMVILLGASLSVSMVCSPARGVLTGFHRWSTNTSITAAGDVVTLAALITVLVTGGGLIGLAAAYLVVSTCTDVTRVVAARRIYGEKLLTWYSRDRAMLKKMFVFGMKNNVNATPHLLVVQTVNIALAAAAGPATLALLARPLALVRQIQQIILKSVMVLTPTAGSLQGLGQQDEIRQLFLAATRVLFAFTIPALLVLALYGDLLVRLWMGPDYVNPLLNVVIAAGVVLPYSSYSSGRILMGMNMHGRVGIRSLVLSVTSLVVGIAVVGAIGWTPVRAAAIIGISISLGPGLVTPISACRRLNVGVADYFGVIAAPAFCNLGFAALIGLPRLVIADMSYLTAAAIVAAGSLLLLASYWIWVLDKTAKDKIAKKLPLPLGNRVAGGASP